MRACVCVHVRCPARVRFLSRTHGRGRDRAVVLAALLDDRAAVLLLALLDDRGGAGEAHAAAELHVGNVCGITRATRVVVVVVVVVAVVVVVVVVWRWWWWWLLF